jgi:hypothetical protein
MLVVAMDEACLMVSECASTTSDQSPMPLGTSPPQDDLETAGSESESSQKPQMKETFNLGNIGKRP